MILHKLKSLKMFYCKTPLLFKRPKLFNGIYNQIPLGNDMSRLFLVKLDFLQLQIGTLQLCFL